MRGLRPPQVGVAGAVRVAQVAGAITGEVTLWRVGLLQVLQLGVLGEVRVHPLQYRGVRPLARPRPQLREAAEAGAGRGGGDAGQVQGGVGAAGGGGQLRGAAAVAVDVETAGGGAGAEPAPGAGPGGLAAQAVELVRDGGGQGEVVQVTQQQPCTEDGIGLCD